MAQVSEISVNVASSSDPNTRIIQVSYVLTLTGAEFVHGPAFEETFTLWARDLDLRVDSIGVHRPNRMIRLRSNLGEPIISADSIKERFRAEWTQNLRSLAEDPDVTIPLPRGRSRKITNTDELSLEVRLTPFRVDQVGPVYFNFTGNFG